MRHAAALILLLSWLGLPACTHSAGPAGSGDRAELGSPFVIAFGETKTLSGSGLTVRFSRVVSDSRCPSDTVCVWAGEVVVAFEVRQGGGSPAEVQLALPAGTHPDTATAEGHSLTLQAVEPYPKLKSPTTQEGYRATLRVDKAQT